MKTKCKIKNLNVQENNTKMLTQTPMRRVRIIAKACKPIKINEKMPKGELAHPWVFFHLFL